MLKSMWLNLDKKTKKLNDQLTHQATLKDPKLSMEKSMEEFDNRMKELAAANATVREIARRASQILMVERACLHTEYH